MDKVATLEKLLADVSYYEAAEGEQYRRETKKRNEVKANLREFCSVHTVKEMEDLLSQIPNVGSYLVYPPHSIFPFCKDAK